MSDNETGTYILIHEINGTASPAHIQKLTEEQIKPRVAANDSILSMPVPPRQLVTEELENKTRVNKNVDLGKREALLSMIDDLNENDNFVLMLAQLKKR